MKIQGMLICLTSFITVSLSVYKEEDGQPYKIHLETFNKECPNLVKVIQDSRIEEYAIDCKSSREKSGRITEKSVVQNTCFYVLNMMVHICKNGLNLTSEYLKLDEKIDLCPINFVRLPQYIRFNNESGKLLTDKEHCKQICFDLDVPLNECIVLYKVNEYLKNITFQKTTTQGGGQETPAISKTEPAVSDFKKTDTHSDGNKNALLQDKNLENVTSTKKNTTSKTETTDFQSKIAVNYSETNTNTIQNNPSATHVQSTSENKKLQDTSQEPQNEDQKSTDSFQLDPVKGVMPEPDEVRQNPMNDFEGDGELEPPLGDGDGLNSEENPIPRTFYEENKVSVSKEPSLLESSGQREFYGGEGFFQAEESHFFFYFVTLSSIIVIGYLGFHNKNKILAYALEGRNSRRSRRRPNSARYKKLESNLEEAIASNASHTTSSSVVY